MDGYSCVLTFKYHDGGCNLIHVHCCIWRTNIPSPVYDQVFHLVVKPRIVKHVKSGYNFTRYQMVEQFSSWEVPDTINVSSVVKTDNGYILIQGAESCLYANNTDIKFIIQRLVDDEKMSNDHA